MALYVMEHELAWLVVTFAYAFWCHAGNALGWEVDWNFMFSSCLNLMFYSYLIIYVQQLLRPHIRQVLELHVQQLKTTRAGTKGS